MLSTTVVLTFDNTPLLVSIHFQPHQSHHENAVQTGSVGWGYGWLIA
ncbi:hypothetical protein [Acinetobacter baumannii]